MSVVLRPYQVRGLDEARAHYRRGVRRVLLVAPTGAGKTVMFCSMVSRHLERGGRVLLIVHRRELLTQAVARLRREGIERVGVILAGSERDREAPVQVASIGTLLAMVRRGEPLPSASLLVLDEAHHYVAEAWGEIAGQYRDAYVIGVTATPERADGTPLGDLFDALVTVASVRELTDLGYLVPCKVIAPRRRRRDRAWPVVDAYREHAGDRPTVIFSRSVDAARDLATTLRSRGVAAAAIDGETPADERESILARFAAGEVRVLTNCYVLTEGWDCPRAEVCILDRGCTSVATYLQIVGRILRPSPDTGKTSALLVDLYGAVHDHGLPDADRTYSLAGRAISHGDAPTRECPDCGATILLALRQCPHCGAELASAVRAPEPPEALVTISRAQLERSYWDELVATARERGYRLGWCVHRWRERYHRFPRALWRETTRAMEATS